MIVTTTHRYVKDLASAKVKSRVSHRCEQLRRAEAKSRQLPQAMPPDPAPCAPPTPDSCQTQIPPSPYQACYEEIPDSALAELAGFDSSDDNMPELSKADSRADSGTHALTQHTRTHHALTHHAHTHHALTQHAFTTHAHTHCAHTHHARTSHAHTQHALTQHAHTYTARTHKSRTQHTHTHTPRTHKSRPYTSRMYTFRNWTPLFVALSYVTSATLTYAIKYTEQFGANDTPVIVVSGGEPPRVLLSSVRIPCGGRGDGERFLLSLIHI